MEEIIKVDKMKVLNFLDVQALVDREIEVYGKADTELVDHLEELGDALTISEIDYMLELIREAKQNKL
jgi:hypothetical protein